MKLYCIRHGESTGNVKHLYFQPPDEPLSKTGMHQANVIAKRVKDLEFDEIITSDYKRAEQTGEIIQKLHGAPIHKTPLLRERGGNSKFSGRSWDDEEVQAHLKRHEAAEDMNFKEHDEESTQELIDRAKAFMEYVQKRDSTTIVAVTHGIFINTLALLITVGDHITPQLRHHFFYHTWMSNTGITVFEEWEPGNWKMLTWNDHAHLS